MNDELTRMWRELSRSQSLLGGLLAGLEDSDLALLASISELERFDAGTSVVKEGEPGDCMYVVVSGKFRVSKVDALSVEIELRIMGEGEVFGEIALLEQTRRTATVSAITPATVFRLERATLEQHTGLTYRIYGNLARILARRLRQSTDEVLLLETWLRLGENDDLE